MITTSSNFFFVSDDRVGGPRPDAQFVENLRDVPVVTKRAGRQSPLKYRRAGCPPYRQVLRGNDTSLDSRRTLNP